MKYLGISGDYQITVDPRIRRGINMKIYLDLHTENKNASPSNQTSIQVKIYWYVR